MVIPTETFRYKGMESAGPDGVSVDHENCGQEAKVKFLPIKSENVYLEISCACGFKQTIVITPADKKKALMAMFLGQEYSMETGFSQDSKRKFVLKPKKS
ncbi:MAG: hypothetical protein NTX14_01720 [Candidatus Nealsonbacteria bacterium]|nr:hypothetical protein [Candidatus Nealsonbacteria bacterium]